MTRIHALYESDIVARQVIDELRHLGMFADEIIDAIVDKCGGDVEMADLFKKHKTCLEFWELELEQEDVFSAPSFQTVSKEDFENLCVDIPCDESRLSKYRKRVPTLKPFLQPQECGIPWLTGQRLLYVCGLETHTVLFCNTVVPSTCVVIAPTMGGIRSVPLHTLCPWKRCSCTRGSDVCLEGEKHAGDCYFVTLPPMIENAPVITESMFRKPRDKNALIHSLSTISGSSKASRDFVKFITNDFTYALGVFHDFPFNAQFFRRLLYVTRQRTDFVKFLTRFNDRMYFEKGRPLQNASYNWKAMEKFEKKGSTLCILNQLANGQKNFQPFYKLWEEMF